MDLLFLPHDAQRIYLGICVEQLLLCTDGTYTHGTYSTQPHSRLRRHSLAIYLCPCFFTASLLQRPSPK